MHSAYPRISLKGIDEAISVFPRGKKKNLKYTLITAIRKYYRTDSDIEEIKKIPVDDLIKVLWDTGDDPAELKEKRKNFSNLKSTLNRDLRDMFNNGKNPEGIKVGRDNVFVMSDEMKEQLIKKFDLHIKSIEVRVPDADDEQEKIDPKLRELLNKMPIEEIIDLLEKANECNFKQELFDTRVLVPKGVYIVGNKKFRRDEQPEKKVALEEFSIDQCPVTNAQFMIFVKETGYKTSAEKRESGEVCLGKYQRFKDPKTGMMTLTYTHGNTYTTVEGAYWMSPFGPGSAIQDKLDHPVVQVSLQDALAFAEWSGKRLVTEFEWEAAARGSDGRLFPWGTDWKIEYCNHDESTISDTTPVDQYGELGKSPFDVYDMIGNIFEWTSTPYNDPFTNNAPKNYYVIKGGSWATNGVLTAAKRLMKHAQSWSNTIGFRCAQDP